MQCTKELEEEEEEESGAARLKEDLNKTNI